MQTTYTSKTGGVAIILFILFLVIAILFFVRQDYFPSGIFLFVDAFLLFLYLTTKYIVSDNGMLTITVAYLKTTIPITEVRSIQMCNDMMSAPAFSIIGRVRIDYGLGRSVIISPRRLLSFCRQLKEINPQIADYCS